MIKKMKYIIMLDFDGTVVDTMKFHGKLAADVMHKYFKMPLGEAEKEYHSTTGIPFPRQLEKIFPNANPALREQCSDEYAERKIREVFEKAKPFPETNKFFQALKKRGIPVIISSSTEAAMINRLLKKFGLIPLVDHAFGLQEGTKPKHIDLMREKYKPSLVVFIGDSASDVALNQQRPNVVTVGKAGPKANGMLSARELKTAGANIATANLLNLLKIKDFSAYLKRRMGIPMLRKE